MIQENKQEVLPIVIKGLLKNSQHHWNTTVQTLTLNVNKQIMEIDPAAYEEVKKKVEESNKKTAVKLKTSEDYWAQLESKVKF